MAQNLKLDPLKKDYVVESGSPVASDRVYERAYFALQIPRNNWMYGGPDVGSDLHLFRQSKRTSETDLLYAARAQSAIDTQLVKKGDATLSQVKNLGGSREGTSNNVEIEPNQQSLSARLSFTPV